MERELLASRLLCPPTVSRRCLLRPRPCPVLLRLLPARLPPLPLAGERWLLDSLPWVPSHGSGWEPGLLISLTLTKPPLPNLNLNSTSTRTSSLRHRRARLRVCQDMSPEVAAPREEPHPFRAVPRRVPPELAPGVILRRKPTLILTLRFRPCPILTRWRQKPPQREVLLRRLSAHGSRCSDLRDTLTHLSVSASRWRTSRC